MSTTSPITPEASVRPPLRAVLVGGGLVGQVSHLKTLTSPRSAVQLAGIIDTSRMRAQQLGTLHEVPHATALDALELSDVDAVVIATPDPSHADLILQSLERGLHVFCEKPLGISSAECQRLAYAATESGLVCQVGYMKRFDPAVSRLVAHIESTRSGVLGVAVEVRDPDAAPFVKEVPLVAAGDDAAPDLLQAGLARLHAEIEELVGRRVTVAELTAYNSFISALIHDLNLARFLVSAPLHVSHGFFGMQGVQVGMHLRTDDGVHVRLAHSQVLDVADYEERFTIYTTCGIYELCFASPYLLDEPTRLDYLAPQDAQHVSERLPLTPGGDSSFFLELQAFAAQVHSGGADGPRNDFADAQTDLMLIEDAFRLAVTG